MKKSIFTKSLLASALALSATYANAAAFQLAEISTSGLGRAYAGEAAIAEDASVVATNPALMTKFKQNEFSVGSVLVNAKVDLDGKAALFNPRYNPQSAPSAQNSPFLAQDIPAKQHDVVPRAFVPNLYVVTPINDRFALGGGMNVNFGMQSKFDSDYSAGIYGGTTKLTAINLNLSGAYRIIDGLSFGFGVNSVYAKAKLERNAGIAEKILDGKVSAALRRPVDAADEETIVSRLQDKAWGFGWNAGLVYEFNENNRIGLAYHSHVDIKFKDDKAYKFNYPNAIENPASLKLNLPAYWEISGYHKMTDKFAMSYSVKRTLWSRFKELHAVYDNGTEALHKPEHFQDSTRIALGASYDVNEALTLRAGIAYDESPIVAPYKSASIPDTDRTWYSLGATYKFTSNLSVDLAYTHIKGKTANFVEFEKDKGLKVEYTSKSKANLFGLNLNYRF
ncbi:porin [Haemophilus haemoglobinophilus]|nr:porin [Canicola haemoglobinophilus]